MGASGSGRWNYHETKRTAEECWTLDVADLQEVWYHGSASGVLRAVKTEGKGSILGIRYTLEPAEEGVMLVVLSYSLGQGIAERELVEHVPLVTTHPNYGGVRFWFACPFSSKEWEQCGCRIGKLYLPPGERRFGCRQCHVLTYKSSQESHRYDRLCGLMAGGAPEAEELLKKTFSLRTRQRRRRALKASPSLLETFDEVCDHQ